MKRQWIARKLGHRWSVAQDKFESLRATHNRRTRKSGRPLSFASTPLLVFALFCSTGHAQFIVAHRGASHEAPENTMAAFRLAWEKQADAVEGDFYLTRDKQIVCIHDKTTKRVAPKQQELTVASATLAELRTLDVGSWKHSRYAGERIPTLREVLAEVPAGKRIFVEIKCGPEILPTLKGQLDASGLNPNQIVIICFNEAVIAQSRQMMPRLKANWLTSYEQKTPLSAWKPDRDAVLKALQRMHATGLGTQGKLEIIDQAFVAAVRNAGVELHVWTVNDAKQARVFDAFDVDSITTDRPAFIRSVIQPMVPVGSR